MTGFLTNAGLGIFFIRIGPSITSWSQRKYWKVFSGKLLILLVFVILPHHLQMGELEYVFHCSYCTMQMILSAMHNFGALAIATLFSLTAVELCFLTGEVPSQKLCGLFGDTSPKRCFGWGHLNGKTSLVFNLWPLVWISLQNKHCLSFANEIALSI